MISDTLSEAVSDIDYYLEKHSACYTGKMREAIIDLKDRMQAIQWVLDFPPVLMPPPEVEQIKANPRCSPKAVKYWDVLRHETETEWIHAVWEETKAKATNEGVPFELTHADVEKCLRTREV